MRPDEFGGTSSAQTHPAIRCAAHHRPQPSRHARLMLRLPPCCTGIRSGEARRHQRASRRCGDDLSSGFTAGAHLLSSARSPERLQCCCPHVVMPLHCDAHHTPCPHESHLLPCCPQRQREPWLSRTAECPSARVLARSKARESGWRDKGARVGRHERTSGRTCEWMKDGNENTRSEFGRVRDRTTDGRAMGRARRWACDVAEGPT